LNYSISCFSRKENHARQDQETVSPRATKEAVAQTDDSQNLAAWQNGNVYGVEFRATTSTLAFLLLRRDEGGDLIAVRLA